MSSVTIERLTGILEDYARRTGASIDILLTLDAVQEAAAAAIAASPKDTALFLFRATVQAFCARMAN